MKTHSLAALAACLLAAQAVADSYYIEPPLFSTAPDPKKSEQTIDRFGPLGMAIDLIQPAFTLRIRSIEEGSPAAASGFRPGQIIHSINGQVLKGIDPRIHLGRILERAEATDGILVFSLHASPRVVAPCADCPGGANDPNAANRPPPAPRLIEIPVAIPALGAYSPTWPLDCPKSEKIVRNHAEYLKAEGSHKGFAGIGMLFLLSTGDEGDLAYVRDWARAKRNFSSMPWHIGYGGIALCEYYLRTGDADVLPVIQEMATRAIEMETFGGWAGRGPLAAVTYGGGGGHLNAGGTLVVATLMLAKECGVGIPDEPFQRILAHFYRWAGRGNNPYGNNKPESGYTDNGKNGKLAFAMAAAAALTPEGENSIYARARDTAAMFSFYSTSYMLHGHTGGGIGEIWRSAAMGLLYEKNPHHYREFMDQRKWHYDLSRRHDGSFGILGGLRYDNVEWGAGYALTYTIPRKTLRLTGAPATPFSKPFALPTRPWGTAADDDFVAAAPPARADGSRFDFSGETLAADASMPMNQRLGGGNADRATMDRFLHHPDYMVRSTAARSLHNHGPDVAMSYLISADARVRRAALEGIRHGNSHEKLLTRSNFALIISRLEDPEESWFVKDAALLVVGLAPADWIAPHAGMLTGFLSHPEWWLQNSALVALTPVVADERCYRTVIPAIGLLARTSPLYNATAPIRWGALPENLRGAAPEIQQLAAREFKEAYTGYQPIDTRSIPALETANAKNLEFIATTLASLDGGLDTLYQIARARHPGMALPYPDIFLNADAARFSPELRQAVATIAETRLIPAYIGASRRALVEEAASRTLDPRRPHRMDGLVDLYQKLGVRDYDWRDFGPAPAAMQWHYHTFAPPEALARDIDKARYRPVTLPIGTEAWFAESFDPAKAGWKVGKQPFGQADGKPGGGRDGCKLDVCRCGEPVATFWENEVLLTKGCFDFPAFRPGHRYRLLVGGMSHVGGGEGYRIYLNGKLLTERERGVGKREGAKPVGIVLDESWWPEFQGGKVTIAAFTFQNNHKGRSNNHFSVWIQEMKVPPLDDAVLHATATVHPMRSAAWQARQDPDNAELQTGDDLFRHDGTFTPNPAISGAWKTIALVPGIDAFDPARPANANRAMFQSITFRDAGLTDDRFWIWSGDTLMDLDRNQALKMIPKEIDGTPYLFIEAGGFNERNPPNWKSQWMVLKRPE